MDFDTQVERLFEMMREANLPTMDEVSIAEGRAIYSAQPGRLGGRIVEMAAVEDRSAEGPTGPIPLRLYRPTGAPGKNAPLLVYYHGGGWVIGDLDTHDRVCRELAERAACLVAAVDYRLAPEHPAPAAAEDAVAALTYLHRHAEGLGADPDRFAVGGDSAGGNLAAVAALAARDAGLPLRAQILVYPATDLRRDADRYASIAEKAEVEPLTRATMDWFVDRYVPDAALADDWRVSPILAPDFGGLAPALVIVAEHDVLRDEGLVYADALDDAGVPVERIVMPGLIHGFFTMGGVLDASGVALDKVAAVLRERFGR